MNHMRRSYSRRFWSKDFDTFVWNGPNLTIEKVQRIPAKKIFLELAYVYVKNMSKELNIIRMLKIVS